MRFARLHRVSRKVTTVTMSDKKSKDLQEESRKRKSHAVLTLS